MFLISNGEQYLNKQGRFSSIDKARVFSKEHFTFETIRKLRQRYPDLMVCRCEIVELERYSVNHKIEQSDENKRQRLLECKKRSTENIIMQLKSELEYYENQQKQS